MRTQLKRTLLFGSLLGVAASAIMPVAQAQTYSGNSVYKVTGSNGSPAVIVANQTPGDRIEVSYPNATQTRRVTANACGLIVLRDTASSPVSSLVSVGGETIDQGSLPQQLLPRCVNGNLEESRSANFRTGTGEVVIVRTPNTVYEAVYSGGRNRRVTANACGYAQVTSSGTYDMTTPEYESFEINGTTYDLDSLPEATPAPLCRSGSLYTPVGWP